jgi:hypothetical protein
MTQAVKGEYDLLSHRHVQSLFRINERRQYKPLIKRCDITKLKQVCPSRTEKKKHSTGETSTYKYSRRRMEEY